MSHGGITGHDHMPNMPNLNPALAHQLSDNLVNGGDHSLFKLLKTTGRLGVADAGNNISPVAYLSVICHTLSEDPAPPQVKQLTTNRSRTNIKGKGIVLPGSIARFYLDYRRLTLVGFSLDRLDQSGNRNLPTLSTQNLRQVSDHVEVYRNVTEVAPPL